MTTGKGVTSATVSYTLVDVHACVAIASEPSFALTFKWAWFVETVRVFRTCILDRTFVLVLTNNRYDISVGDSGNWRLGCSVVKTIFTCAIFQQNVFRKNSITQKLIPKVYLDGTPYCWHTIITFTGVTTNRIFTCLRCNITFTSSQLTLVEVGTGYAGTTVANVTCTRSTTNCIGTTCITVSWAIPQIS